MCCSSLWPALIVIDLCGRIMSNISSAVSALSSMVSGFVAASIGRICACKLFKKMVLSIVPLSSFFPPSADGDIGGSRWADGLLFQLHSGVVGCVDLWSLRFFYEENFQSLIT